MTRTDLKVELKELYGPPADRVTMVAVPPMQFLAIDGAGGPEAEAYQQATEALYAASYTLKFLIKRGPQAADYAVMPLEGLWWADDMASFSGDRRDDWRWTSMIMQPEHVMPALVERAREQVAKKRELAALSRMRFETFDEGWSAQIMHVGPYSAEGPTIARLHAFIAEQGHVPRGKHHEIYLGDPRRTAPERLKTIIRQPFA